MKRTPKIVNHVINLDEKQTINLFNNLINKSSKSKSNIPKNFEKIISMIDSSKGCIILDPGFSPNPENLMPAVMNLLIRSENPDGFIPYYQGGNDQGIFDMGAIQEYQPGYVKPKKKGKKYTEMLNGGVKALYLTEPASVKNIEFLVLQDIYPSEIMNKADVVLPACAFTENGGTVTSLERRIQSVKKAVDAQGVARPDWKIISEIAKEMNAKGFGYKNHQTVFKEIKQTVPFISGTGIWSFKDKKTRSIPLNSEKTIKKLPLKRPIYRYRGADLIERVDDFKTQIEKGGF